MSHLHKLWGPGLWRFMHTISFHYPINDVGEYQSALMDFFYSLTLILPCNICRINYIESVSVLGGLTPRLFQTKESTSMFVYTLHNLINNCIGKKRRNPPFDAIKKKYSKNTTSQSWFWGPGLWSFMHTMSVNMPTVLNPRESEAVTLFLESLQSLIPCNVCRVHYIENTRHVTVNDIKSNKALALTIYELHNTVNKSLNRKPYKTFKIVYDKYNLNQ